MSQRLRAALALITALALLGVIAGALAFVPSVWVGHKVQAASAWWDSIPVNLDDLPSELPSRVSVVDANGAQFATFYSENRIPLDSLDQVSKPLIDAVLAVEDDRFYTHGALDFGGTARALIRDSMTGKTQGGSTITQQYVKNLRVAAASSQHEAAAAIETSLYRKVVELKWAAALEQAMSKDQILLGYLNIAYFGNGAYGIGAASQFYFGEQAADLTVAQGALLAGLLRNPSGYDPLNKPDAALARRATALTRMVSAGRLSQEAADAAGAEPLGAARHDMPNGCTESTYPYYCAWVRQTLLDDPAFGATSEERQERLYHGGFTVHTAMDPKAMAAAQQAADAALPYDGQAAAAVAVIVPGTGRVAGIAQTSAYQTTQFSYAVQAQLQPGSTFKPITLATALEQGFDPETKLASSTPYTPHSMNAPAGGFGNVDGRNRGNITAREALKHSVNTWFVRLIERTGTSAVADMAYRLGMTSMDPATRHVGASDASLTLGAFETTPVDLANVYATFAASGVHCKALPIISTTDADGTDNPWSPGCEQVLSPSIAATVAQGMTGAFESGGTADGLALDRPAAGKTGTTNDNGATWFAGFTPQYATAVWVGDPRGPSYSLTNVIAYGKRHAHVYGATIAGPIWHQTMATLHEGAAVQPLAVPGPITTFGSAVPDVRGIGASSAVGVLGDAGYQVTGADGEPLTSADATRSVVAQVPAPGTRVAPGATVRLDLGSTAP